MTDLLHLAQDTLARAGYTVESANFGDRPALVFEDDTYLGFVVAYPDASALLDARHHDEREFLARYTPDLRAARDKAWNTYFVWLARDEPSLDEAAELDLLEEDLAGARKIAAAGLQTADDVDAALVNLYRLQTPPRLDRVDIPAEIAARTPELDPHAIEAFLSDAPPEQVVSVLQNLPS